MRVRRFLGCAAVATLGIAAGVTALRGDDSASSDEVLYGDEIRELLAILESEAFRDPGYLEMRLEAMKHLRRVVTKGGDGLREAALRRMREPRSDARQRAQLVLAQIAELPDESVRPLLDEEDIEVSTWAYLVLSARDGALRPPSRELETITSAADESVPAGRDPLLDVHANIRDALDGRFELIDGVAMTSRDHADDEVWRYDLTRRTLDLDGDGVAEHFVCAELSGVVEFLAVLRRPDADASWELTALGRPKYAHHARPVVADFDGDGRPDLGVEYDNCGIPSYGAFCAYSASDRAFVDGPWAYHARVRVLLRRADEAPVFVDRDLYKDNYGGTAIHCAGVCAMRHELLRWDGQAFTRVGVVFVRSDE